MYRRSSLFTHSLIISGWLDWKVEKNAMDDVRRDGREKRRKLRTEAEEVIVTAEGIIKPLTMVHMQRPFLLYILCVIVTSIVFLVEVVRAPFLQRNQEV